MPSYCDSLSSVINEQNPDVALVCAMGHEWGPNEERGVFRSTDGGASWQKVLYLDDRHGVSDLDIDPTNPNILYAGLWLRRRGMRYLAASMFVANGFAFCRLASFLTVVYHYRAFVHQAANGHCRDSLKRVIAEEF